MLFGVPVVSIWYWCVDQEMAQRVLSAPDIAEARLGTGFAAMLKVIPVFITGWLNPTSIVDTVSVAPSKHDIALCC